MRRRGDAQHRRDIAHRDVGQLVVREVRGVRVVHAPDERAQQHRARRCA